MERAQRHEMEQEKHVAHVEKAKNLLEIEKARINQLLNILADISTQGALLAGCAVGAMSGESLDSFDDETYRWDRLGVGLSIACGATALASSLWVIFIASHLIALTRDSALKPKIAQARKILEAGLADVRTMQWVALASLLLTVTVDAILNTTALNGIIIAAIVLMLTVQAVLKKEYISQQFSELDDSWRQTSPSMGKLVGAFNQPFRHYFNARVASAKLRWGDGALISFVSHAFSLENDGMIMMLLTFALTLVLELFSVDAVLKVVRAKQGAKLYAQGVLCNVVNNLVLGPLAYHFVTTRYVTTPYSAAGRVGMLSAIIVGHSIGYYLAHRWMHTRRMYWAHRFHHRFNVHVVPMTANAVSLAEYTIAYMMPFIAGSAFLRPDRLSLFLAVGLISFNNLLIHTPRLADASARLVPWLFVSTEMHLEHHKRLTTHWAAPTISIDRLLECVVGRPASYGKEFKDD